MPASQNFLKKGTFSLIIISCLFLSGCGNKSDLYMPGESPEEKVINKKKEQIKANEAISPGANSEDVKSKYYEKENDQIPVISHPKTDD